MRRNGNRQQRAHVLGSTSAHGCGGKRTYATWSEAEQEAKRTRRHTESDVEPYSCRGCHGFHVGASGRRRKAINQRKG